MSASNGTNDLEWEHYTDPAQETSRARRRGPPDGSRSRKCSLCERSFDRPSSLAQHMNVHTGQKPHACSFCAMRFTTSSNMYRHTRSCPSRPRLVPVDGGPSGTSSPMPPSTQTDSQTSRDQAPILPRRGGVLVSLDTELAEGSTSKTTRGRRSTRQTKNLQKAQTPPSGRGEPLGERRRSSRSATTMHRIVESDVDSIHSPPRVLHRSLSDSSLPGRTSKRSQSSKSPVSPNAVLPRIRLQLRKTFSNVAEPSTSVVTYPSTRSRNRVTRSEESDEDLDSSELPFDGEGKYDDEDEQEEENEDLESEDENEIASLPTKRS